MIWPLDDAHVNWLLLLAPHLHLVGAQAVPCWDIYAFSGLDAKCPVIVLTEHS